VATYALYGLAVTSDVPFPELAAGSPPAALTIEAATVTAPPSPAWFDIWPHSDGRSWVRACPTASGYQVHHGDRAAFDVDRTRRRIAYDAPTCDAALLRHFLIDQVVPLALSLDALILHASSVAAPGGTLAFVGPGGAGKSTLALALARAGWPMVSDDGLLLRLQGASVTATPGYRGVRLWRDSAAALAANARESIAGAAGNKHCYREPAAFTDDVPPLARIYAVDPRPAGAVAIERLSGADAVIAIVRQTYRLALDDREALGAELDAIVALTRRVPVWRLSFPRALGDLASLAAAIAPRLWPSGAPS
jgi:hypothetical protein